MTETTTTIEAPSVLKSTSDIPPVSEMIDDLLLIVRGTTALKEKTAQFYGNLVRHAYNADDPGYALASFEIEYRNVGCLWKLGNGKTHSNVTQDAHGNVYTEGGSKLGEAKTDAEGVTMVTVPADGKSYRLNPLGGMPNAYRSAKSVIEAAFEEGVDLLSDDDGVRGKTEVEKELKEAREAKRDPFDAPIAALTKALDTIAARMDKGAELSAPQRDVLDHLGSKLYTLI